MRNNIIVHSIDSNRIKKDHFLACVEIPAGCKNKYELDEDSGYLMLDRILFTSTHYPHNYGFIPKTWGLDDDPLDVMIVTSEPIVPMALVRCHPVGMLNMKDSGFVDEKIIAVCDNDPFYAQIKQIHELPNHLLDEIRHFFKVYKQLENGKPTEIGGFENREVAEEAIEKAIARYKDKFEK